LSTCRYDASPLVYSKHEERINMANSSKRFATVTENDLRKLLDEKEAVNTKRATKTAVKVFTEYIIEKKISEPQDKDSIAKVLTQRTPKFERKKLY
jgi:hypothetical protein